MGLCFGGFDFWYSVWGVFFVSQRYIFSLWLFVGVMLGVWFIVYCFVFLVLRGCFLGLSSLCLCGGYLAIFGEVLSFVLCVIFCFMWR